MKQRNEGYTCGTLRRAIPECYVDDLCVWGGRVLAVMALVACALWLVEGFR